MFGLRVDSEIAMAISSVDSAAGDEAAWIVRYAGRAHEVPEPDGPVFYERRCYAPCHNGDTVIRVYRGPGGSWLWGNGIGTFHVLPGARQVNAYIEQEADERFVGNMVLGYLSAFVLHQLGHATLHASAVVTTHGAVVFMGPSGRGKSTMAAAFLRRGASLLTDDVLRLYVEGDSVYGVPSFPVMKLWDPSLECALDLHEELPDVAATVPKKIIGMEGRFGFNHRPVPIRGFYVLNRYENDVDPGNEVTVTRISGQASLKTLLDQVPASAYLDPKEKALFLPRYAQFTRLAPVSLLSYPNGFEHQQAIYECVIRDVEPQ
jgi:hypothetical protein